MNVVMVFPECGILGLLHYSKLGCNRCAEIPVTPKSKGCC